MFNGLQETIINLIQDWQPVLVPLLALCFVVAGTVMMFGDMGRRWAKTTLIFSIIGFVIAAGALVFARSSEDTLKVSSIQLDQQMLQQVVNSKSNTL
ncbi:hypothetical protein P1A20_12815 [Staphylococcus equorum]|uniref:hypothetical protein n=1 Tax=Staphylococcus equorum TaxID=246432 RepID=UPI002552D2B3|nr:hypothetical protein [Staphylococcus equorum]MDK9847467.1 hypothetical protein [Staphylococcus equorum]